MPDLTERQIEMRRARSLAYYYRHHERNLQAAAAYREANREALREKSREYVERTRDERRARGREAARRYRERHPERAKAVVLAYDEAHRQKRADARREWRKANPDKKVAQDVVRRARKQLQSITAEPVSRAAIIARDKQRCHLCGKRVPKSQIHLDHLVPLALGGAHTAANVAVAHASCNIQKRTKASNEQLRLVG